MILDVACGEFPVGDVNLDLHPHEWVDGKCDLTKAKDFIKADAHHLPFRDNSFELVVCTELLEHSGINPDTICRELLRVSREKIKIQVPNCLSAYKYGTDHIRVWTKDAFHTIFKHFKRRITYTLYDWHNISTPFKLLTIYLQRTRMFRGRFRTPQSFIKCPIPSRINVEVWKDVS